MTDRRDSTDSADQRRFSTDRLKGAGSRLKGAGRDIEFPSDRLGQVKPDASLLTRVGHIAGRARGLVLGDERHFPIRILSLFILLCMGVFSVSVYLFLQVEAEAHMESGWIVRGVVGFVTNPWVYTVMVIVTTIVLWLWLADVLAKQTAKKTRFSKRTVKRFAAEVKSTDGCVRLIGTSGHTVEDLRRKLEYALVNYGEVPDERHDRYDVDVPLEDDDTDEVGVSGALVAAEATDGRPTPDGHDTLEDALTAGHEAATAVADALDEDGPPRAGWMLGADSDADSAHSSTVDGPASSLEAALAEASEDGASASPAENESDGNWGPDSLRDQLTLLRMDAATALSWSELGRRFVLPAVGTLFLFFTAMQSMWLHPILYVAGGALSLTVGTVTYAATKARRRHHLAALREERTGEPLNSANALVKPVETPEATGYIAFLPGHVYFDFDRQRFVRKVGRRWHQAINNATVWPSIQEKFAARVRQYMPTITEMEQNDPRDGRKAIYNDIADVIRQAENPDGLVPKRVLGERVVQVGPGVGHDPEIVAQAYRDLYEAAWQEIGVMVPDADGTSHEMTMVHLRGQPIQDNVARLMANYSHEFDPHREARYPLPEIDDAPAITQQTAAVDVTSAAPTDVASTGD